MYTAAAYTIYLALALVVVVVVGRRLFVNGRFYLVELFHDEHLADVVNRVLYMGYCLINIGGAFRCLSDTGELNSFREVFEYIIRNQGQLLLLLGLMHAFNLVVLPLLKGFLRDKLSARPNEKEKITQQKSNR